MSEGEALFPRDAVALVAAFVLDAAARARGRGQTIRPDIVDAAELMRVKAIAASLESVSAHGRQASRATVESASWSTSSAIAEAARCSPRTVVRAIHRGELRAVRQGRDHLINAQDAARWIERRRTWSSHSRSW